jgi:hypothetical protein
VRVVIEVGAGDNLTDVAEVMSGIAWDYEVYNIKVEATFNDTPLRATWKDSAATIVSKYFKDRESKS